MSRIGQHGTLVATSYHDRMTGRGFRLWDISEDDADERLVPSHPYCVFRTGDRRVAWEPLANSSSTWNDDPAEMTPLPFSDRYYGDIDFNPDFTLAFQGSVSGMVEVFDLETDHAPRLLDLFARASDDSVMALAVHPDGDRLLAVSSGAGIAVWKLPGLELHAGPGPAFDSVCWLHRTRDVVAISGDALVVLDGDSFEVIRRADQLLPGSVMLSGQGESLSMTGNGRWIVVSTMAGTQLVDPDTLTLVGEPFPHDSSTWCSAIDEAAPRLVTNDGPWVKIWELEPECWLAVEPRQANTQAPVPRSSPTARHW